MSDESVTISIKHSVGRVRAIVSPLAASLKLLEVDGVELVESPDPALTGAAGPPFAAGIVLVPWPNRVEDGRWWLDGIEQRLEITEPELGHANHGLLAAEAYRIERRDVGAVALAATIRDAPGYPFSLDTRVEYRLTATGVTVSHTIENVGPEDAPVAVGAHPYLRLGDVPTADLTLVMHADRAFDLDHAHIPRSSFDVAGTPFDLRGGVRIAQAVRHAAYAGFSPTGDVIRHELRAPDGRAVQLWSDPDFAYAQVFITERFPAAGGERMAVAVEPMTAPPNALRTGEALRWLSPGESWTVSWGIALVGARVPVSP